MTSNSGVPVPAGYAVRQLIEHLGQCGDDWHAGEECRIIDQLFSGYHPATLLFELIDGLPLLKRDNTLAIRYDWIFSEIWRKALRDHDWPLKPEDYVRAIDTYRDIASQEVNRELWSPHIPADIVRRASAFNTPELREAIGGLVEAVVSSEPNRTPSMLDRADSWMVSAGLTRADIPALRKVDEIAIQVQAARKLLFEAAGPLLAPVLAQFLDGEIKSYEPIKRQTRELDALLAASTIDQGAALTFLLDRIIVKGAYKDHSELARRDGRWAHAFHTNARPSPALDRLALELAKQSHQFNDPEAMRKKLASLKAHIDRTNKRNWPNPLGGIAYAIRNKNSLFKMDWQTFRTKMKIHRNPMNWFYSDDNHGRFVAFDSILGSMFTGALLMWLLIDVYYLVEHGLPTLRSAIISAAVIYFLVQLLPTAVSSLTDIEEIHVGPPAGSLLPRPLIALAFGASIVIGAVTILAFRGYLFELSALHGVLLVYGISTLASFLVWILIAFFIAWFVMFPEEELG